MHVVGPSGSGKTTLARAIAARLGATHVELDAFFHGPGWTPVPSFRQDVARALEAEAWVVDGNYGSRVRDLVWPRAEALVWLDLPRRVVFPSLLARTLRRGWTGEVLWNGNRERLANLLSPRAEDNLMLWTWRHYPAYRASYAAAMTDPALAHLRVFRIRRRDELPALMAAIR